MGVKWSEMTPRERDALVAEKVMGFVLTGDGFVHSPSGALRLQSYTTDISAAWEVVERMRDKGFWLSDLSIDKRPDEPFYYECNFYDANYEEWVLTDLAEAPTASESICLAALKAVGVEIE